jgi:hypothetical protein
MSNLLHMGMWRLNVASTRLRGMRRGEEENQTFLLPEVNMLLTEHRPRYFVRRGSITAAILGWRSSTQFAGRQLYGCVGVLGGDG